LDLGDILQFIVLPALVYGLIAAGLVAYGLFCTIPALRVAGARPGAMLVAHALTAAGPVLIALGALIGIPIAWIAVVGLALLAIGSQPTLFVRILGGPRPMEPSLAALFAEIEAANRLLEIGDVDAWSAAIDRLDRRRVPQLDRYVDLLQRFAQEEQGRRAGSRQSSRTTLMEIDREAARLRAGIRPPAPMLAAAVVMGFLIAAAPTLAVEGSRALDAARACPDALGQVDAAGVSGSGVDVSAWPISHLVLVDPRLSDASLRFDGRLDLDGAAVSRHNPRARAILVESGFRDGYLRAWETAAGRLVQAEILVFESVEGARTFHREFTAYACRFSSQAFAGIDGAVGLQVRYGAGDPIREQLTWVDGPMRVQVSMSFESEPADHARILALAMIQREQLEHPE
jgi:hypothetical protein